MVSKKMFSSLIEEWETPEEVFLPLEKEFGPFDLDPAADSRNTRAPKFYSIEDNGLSKSWNGRVWLNPPYGRDIGSWMQKAGHEVLAGRAAIVVALVPARVDTAWWHDWVQGQAAEVRFLRGRVRFKAPHGLKMSSAPFPSAIVIFRTSDRG